MSVISVLLAGLVTCGGVDDTATLQSALDADSIEVVGACAINGAAGVTIPSDRTLDLRQSTWSLLPGCNFRCKALQTAPDASNIRIQGGLLRGSRTPAAGLQWRIGLRIDKAYDVVVEDTAFEDWYTDGIWLGGNAPGFVGVRLRGVRVSNSKRNGLSVTNGDGLTVERSTFETTNCASDAPNGVCPPADLNMPRCGIDVEPNGGDIVHHFRLIDSLVRLNERCGVFVQSGLGSAGAGYELLDNTIEANGTIGLIVNQVSDALVKGNKVTGGTIGFSLGAGVRAPVFLSNEVSGNSGNAINFAGVWDPIVARNKANGRPVAYIGITSPVVLNGVAGDITIKPFLN